MPARKLVSHGITVVLVTAVAWVTGPIASAVVIANGDGSGNASPPPDDPGWSNVGRTSDGTAVYLGDRWVITANHAATGAVTFPSGTFGHEPGTVVRLENPPGMGLTPRTDIKLYRLLQDPALPVLAIGSSTPPVGAEVLMMGTGRDRLPALRGWDVTNEAGDWIWTPVSPPANGDVRGYATSTNANARTLRWGDNLVNDHRILDGIGNGDVIGLTTEFDEAGTTWEAHAASGDSGGPLFWKHDGRWELAGMIDAAFGLHGQPQNTAVMANPSFIGNLLFSADLTAYRVQIEDVTGLPEPGTLAVLAVALCAAGRRGPAERRARPTPPAVDCIRRR